MLWHKLQAISSEVLLARQELGEVTPQLGSHRTGAVSPPECRSLNKLRGILFHLLLKKGGESISSQTHHGEHRLTL